MMKKPVIFLAFANDKTDKNRYLRNLSDELHQIREKLKVSDFEVIERANLRTSDIFDVFTENEVSIFHYGGHAGDAQLLLEAKIGNETAFSAPLMKFLASQKSLKLVFLNGCSTKNQVKKLQENIPAVIGTCSEIDDEIAKNLAVRFYQTLGAFKTVQEAWETAQYEIQTPRNKNFRALYRKGKAQNEFPWELVATEEGRNWKIEPFRNTEKELKAKIEKLTQDFERQQKTIKVHEKVIETLTTSQQKLEAEKEEIQAQLKDKSETISETEAQNKLAEIEQKAHEIQRQLDQKSQKITTLETKNRQLRLDLLGKSQEINQLNARIKSLEETKVQATKLKQQTKDPKIKQGLELIEQDQAHCVEELLPDEDLNKEKIQIRERHKEDYRQLAQKYIVKALGAKARFEFALADKYYQKATQECPDAEFWFAYAHFLNEQNHKNKAISYYEKALAQRKTENAKGEKYATVLNNLGLLYSGKNEFEKGEKCYKESLETYQGLAEKNPEVYDLDVCMTSLNICILYEEYTQEGKSHYASLALDLLEDVAERLQKYPNIPQANHYKNTGLIPLQDYFRQYQGHLYEGAFEVLPEEKEEYEIFDIFQEAEQHRTNGNTQEAQNLYKKCIAEWAEIPLSENDDLDTYAESHLRLAQLQGTRTDMAITPALDNYQEALRLFLLQTDDYTTWEYLLETGYFYALELKKGIWLGTRKRIKREIKAIQNQVFEALSDKNLNETTQDWKQKLAEVLDKK